MNLTDAAIATSGSYERRIAYQGKDYGHLLDPETGWPARGPASVTVIDAHCLTAGAVATTACLQTEEKAANWLGRRTTSLAHGRPENRNQWAYQQRFYSVAQDLSAHSGPTRRCLSSQTPCPQDAVKSVSRNADVGQ